jgi:hypothetical protein
MTSQRLLQPSGGAMLQMQELRPVSTTVLFHQHIGFLILRITRRINKPFVWPQYLDIPYSLRVPVIKSLQRFQIGETGDGNHLRKYAKTLNDPLYEQCIDLFVKEENGHALVLARIIELMDGYLITWHWSDYAFVNLRHLLGLKTEVFIILTAEIVGKCFYKACADRLPEPILRDIFSSIVLDELAHLKFHWSFMRREMLPISKLTRRAIYYFWSAVFLAICCVFVIDHGETLRALGKSPRSFLSDCLSLYKRRNACSAC